MNEDVRVVEARKMATRFTECEIWPVLEKRWRANGRSVQVEESNCTVFQEEIFGMKRAELGNQLIYI